MSGVTTPRSQSRAKRSTTNLRDLRLAPLSTKYEQPQNDTVSARSPYGETPDNEFARQHSSYLQGRSAPSPPGILNRSSRRRRSGAGLSRQEPLYDDLTPSDDMDLTMTATTSNNTYSGRRYSFNDGDEFGTRLTKAKSEAALYDTPFRMSTQAGPRSSHHHHHHHHQQRPSGGRSGPPRPEAHRRTTSSNTVDNSWMMRTGAAASAILQESKGQSWLASRDSSAAAAMGVPASSGDEAEEEDDDEGYEEMAAISKLRAASAAVASGHNSRRASRWGSRYGSRSASRRASRAVSPKGSRTPRQSDPTGYFDDAVVAAMLPVEEPGFVNPRERPERYQDQDEVERLTSTQSFGLGTIVDSLMNFKLFKVDDQGETTEDEAVASPTRDPETDEEARERMAAEARRRREEKASLTKLPPAPEAGLDGQGEAGGWQDAAWLLSVASKALW